MVSIQIPLDILNQKILISKYMDLFVFYFFNFQAIYFVLKFLFFLSSPFKSIVKMVVSTAIFTSVYFLMMYLHFEDFKIYLTFLSVLFYLQQHFN